ncbi:MAG: hypothetical protein QOH93_1546 [Chloroflexia bacterium]|jgi:hypothetical protein|nr:hypothetical protein [Chloroflexia bacterium]
MESEQPREGQESVQRDRKERGETRDAHLDAAREQARQANAEARERSQAGDEADDQAVSERLDANEATMKAKARANYEGTDDAFEEDWPAIRERLASEDMQKSVERIRRRF